MALWELRGVGDSEDFELSANWIIHFGKWEEE